MMARAVTRLVPANDLYDRDFYAWARRQERALASRDGEALDIVNLIEEVEALGRSQRSAIESHLRILIVHLLKYMYQPERATVSWQVTLNNQRQEIARLLDRNPSLHAYPAEILAETYHDAVRRAAQETGLDEDAFPGAPPFTLTQILDAGFLP